MNKLNIKNLNDIEDAVYDLCQILNNNLTNSKNKERIIKILNMHITEYFKKYSVEKKKEDFKKLLEEISYTISELYRNSERDTKWYIRVLIFDLIINIASVTDEKTYKFSLTNFYNPLINTELKRVDKNDNILVELLCYPFVKLIEAESISLNCFKTFTNSFGDHIENTIKKDEDNIFKGFFFKFFCTQTIRIQDYKIQNLAGQGYGFTDNFIEKWGKSLETTNKVYFHGDFSQTKSLIKSFSTNDYRISQNGEAIISQVIQPLFKIIISDIEVKEKQTTILRFYFRIVFHLVQKQKYELLEVILDEYKKDYWKGIQNIPKIFPHYSKKADFQLEALLSIIDNPGFGESQSYKTMALYLVYLCNTEGFQINKDTILKVCDGIKEELNNKGAIRWKIQGINKELDKIDFQTDINYSNLFFKNNNIDERNRLKDTPKRLLNTLMDTLSNKDQ